MIGDCDNCGHSIAYHAPLFGCIKCDCAEFRMHTVVAVEFLDACERAYASGRVSKEQVWRWLNAYAGHSV